MLNGPQAKMGSRLSLVAAVAAVTLTAFTANASAARDPIAGGTTDLHMKRGFLRKLANNGIAVEALGATTVSGNKIALGVKGGRLDPIKGDGFLETRAGFKLARGERGVPVLHLTVNTARLSVYANVAKARMQMGTLLLPTTSREGFGANLKVVKLSLSAKAARRISNRLGLRGSHRLNPGRALSNVYCTAQPELVEVLSQGSATLTGNTQTLQKFAAKGVELPGGIAAISPATKPAATSFQFPIAGGTVAPDLSGGTVATSGGVQILKQAEPYSPMMRMRNIEVDFGTKAAMVEIEILPTPPFPGPAGRSSIVDVVVDPKGVTVDPAARTIAIKDAEARLQAVAASTLNSVFNQPAPEPPPSSNFVVGDPLGTFSMTLQAR